MLDVVPSQDCIEEDACRRLDREKLERTVWVAVDQLPGDQPAVLRMIYLGGLNRREAGEKLGVSLSKARDIELKALRTFRNTNRSLSFRHIMRNIFLLLRIHHVV